MEEDKIKMKHIACLGCRIRRRKCDTIRPICSGCLEINIPEKLCIYHGARVGFKVGGSRNNLDKLKEKNSKLLKEETILKKAINKASRIHNAPEIYYLFQKDENSLKKNPLMCTIGECEETLTHYGPLSWFALMSTQEPLKQLSDWFINVIKLEKDRFDKIKIFPPKAEEDEELSLINYQLRTYAMGQLELVPDKMTFINNLLRTIALQLPTKSETEQLLTLYSFLNRQNVLGFIYLDGASFFESFQKYIKFDSEGNAVITIHPTDYQQGTSFTILYLSMLAFLGLNPAFPQVKPLHMLEFLKTLLLARGILQINGSSSISSHLDPETLFALMHTCVYERCTPYGRQKQQEGMFGADDILTVRQLIIYARILRLDQDIDIVYSHKTQEYREGLKSIWTTLVYSDIAESLETGIPLRIESKELVRYKDYPSLYVRALVVLNDVLNQFNDKLVITTDKPALIEWIRTDLVTKLDDFFTTEYVSAQDHINYLKSFDFENNISGASEYIHAVQGTTIRLLFYSMSALLFQFCATVANQIGHDGDVKRFGYLSTKRMALLVLFLRDFFAAVRIAIDHKNSEYFAIPSSLTILARQMAFSLRRVSIHIGGVTLKNFDHQYSIRFFNSLINDSDRYAKILLDTLMRSTSSTERYAFTLPELEDFEIEKDIGELDRVFFKLLEYRYLTFETCRLLQQIDKSMDNKKYNMNFLRLDYIFFYSLRSSNLFLALAYSSYGLQTNTQEMNKAGLSSDMKKDEDSDSKQQQNNLDTNEFDFNDLFERAIDTNSEKFDFKSFFTTDSYQQNDIDEFLENLTIPPADYYSNNSQYNPGNQ